MDFAERDDLALSGDAFVIHKVELGLLEWGSDFVLHHFDADAASDDFFTLLYLGDATYIEAH